MEVWQPVYVGIGSNLEDPVRQVTGAINNLSRLADSRLVQTSALVRSPPLDNMDQPDYVNAVAALLTQLTPAELLGELQQLENTHGRERAGPRWGPRTLDLDILVFGDVTINTKTLTVPHPHLTERSFVLGPLNEIAPTLQIPGHARVKALTACIDLTTLERIETQPGETHCDTHS